MKAAIPENKGYDAAIALYKKLISEKDYEELSSVDDQALKQGKNAYKFALFHALAWFVTTDYDFIVEVMLANMQHVVNDVLIDKDILRISDVLLDDAIGKFQMVSVDDAVAILRGGRERKAVFADVYKQWVDFIAALVVFVRRFDAPLPGDFPDFYTYDIAQIILDFERPCLVDGLETTKIPSGENAQIILDAFTETQERIVRFQMTEYLTDHMNDLRDKIIDKLKCLEMALSDHTLSRTRRLEYVSPEYLATAFKAHTDFYLEPMEADLMERAQFENRLSGNLRQYEKAKKTFDAMRNLGYPSDTGVLLSVNGTYDVRKGALRFLMKLLYKSLKHSLNRNVRLLTAPAAAAAHSHHSRRLLDRLSKRLSVQLGSVESNDISVILGAPLDTIFDLLESVPPTLELAGQIDEVAVPLEELLEKLKAMDASPSQKKKLKALQTRYEEVDVQGEPGTVMQTLGQIKDEAEKLKTDIEAREKNITDAHMLLLKFSGFTAIGTAIPIRTGAMTNLDVALKTPNGPIRTQIEHNEREFDRMVKEQTASEELAAKLADLKAEAGRAIDYLNRFQGDWIPPKMQLQRNDIQKGIKDTLAALETRDSPKHIQDLREALDAFTLGFKRLADERMKLHADYESRAFYIIRDLLTLTPWSSAHEKRREDLIQKLRRDEILTDRASESVERLREEIDALSTHKNHIEWVLGQVAAVVADHDTPALRKQAETLITDITRVLEEKKTFNSARYLQRLDRLRAGVKQTRDKRIDRVKTLIDQAQTSTDLNGATDLLTQAEELAQGLDPAVLEDVRTARQALNEKREDLAMSCENVKNYVKALPDGSNDHQKRKLGLIEQLDVCTPDTETVLSLEQAAEQLARDIGEWNGEKEAFKQDVRNLLDVIENAVNERDEQALREDAKILKERFENLLTSDDVVVPHEWETDLDGFRDNVSASRKRRIRAVRDAIEQAKRKLDVQLLADALEDARWLGPDLLQEVQDAQANIIATRKGKRTELETQVNAIKDDLKGATNEHDYGELRERAQELETQMIDLLRTPEEIEFDHAAARRNLDDLKRDIGKTREKRTNEVNVNLVSVVRAALASPDYDIAIKFDELQGQAMGLSDKLQRRVQHERKRVEGVRRDELLKFVDTALDQLSVKPLENATRLVSGLPDRDSLLAKIDATRRKIENKLAHQERVKHASELVRVGNKWIDDADNFFAASIDPNATAFDRYKAAMDAKNAADKGLDFWRQAMRIYRADDPERPIFQLEIDEVERDDFAANVERAYAAYLAQLERERKEALAKRLREGDVPAAAATEALCVAPPLRTREQLAAASALADFMREMPEWYDVYEKWKLHYRRCVNGHKYLEINNVGSWTCRQHALPPDARDGRHPCCDKSDAGCVRADHRNGTAPFTAAQTICGVPDFILRAMTSTARPGRRGKDAFVRFDEAEHARRSKPAIRVIHTPRGRDDKKTVDVLLPDVLTLERSATENRVRMPGDDGDEVWLWDWNQASQPRVARIIYLDQVSYFIYRETKDTVTFKVALLVRDVPVITQSGRRGVPYRNHPQAKLEFTPLERATLWPSSSDY